jgi:outer membrane receptor protein involved in Fe transport
MKGSKNYDSARRIFLLLSAIPISFAPQLSSAQAETDTRIEEIMVTGSRIKRPIEDAAVSIMDIDRNDIETSGDIDLSRMIRELPQIYEGTSTENSQSSAVSSGLATVELRNLGDDRTLVLIDGKRTVSNSLSTNSVSFDTIPSGFIDRVEVVTGGASAVYGSDAVTGVVNLITRDYFEGVEVDARYGMSQESDGEQIRFQVTAGTNFADDKGNVLVNYTYDEADAVLTKDRDWTQSAMNIDGNPALNSSIPGGRYQGNAFFYDIETNQLMTGFSTSQNGFNEAAGSNRTMRIPKERNLLAAKLRYDINDNLAVVLHSQYAHIWTNSNREPRNANDGASSLATLIPLNNPFIPQPILDHAIANSSAGISHNRRYMELGDRNRGGDRDVLRVWLGLEGRINDKWDWEVFYGTHEFRYSQTRTGNLNKINFAQAMDVEPDPENPGEYRCVSSVARNGGCVPINIFGNETITPEGAAWLNNNDLMNGINKEDQIAAVISGDIFDLPGGSVGVAAGAEYRDVSSVQKWDDISNAGYATISQQVDQSGEFDVSEAFVEAIVPIFEGFDLEMAYRFASYDMPAVDTTSSYRFGLNWGVNDWIRVRTMYGTAERAPNVLELYSVGSGATSTINDPCDGVTLTSAGTADDNCRSIPSVLTNIQDNGSFTRDTTVFISYPLSGNPQLLEESAKTYTAGVVLKPPAIEGLTLTLDYYNIEIDDAISSLGRQEIVDLCLENDNFDPNDLFCSVVFREENTGEIYLVERKQININTLKTNGIDTTLNYNFDLGFMPGDFTLDMQHTYVAELEETFPAAEGTVTVDNLGLVPNPEHRMRAGLSWLNADWNVRWKLKMWGDVEDGAELADGSILTVDTYFRNDLYVSRTFNWFGENGDSLLYFGIDNVFDKDPPLLLTGSEYGGTTLPTNTAYDLIGRFFYAGIKLQF